MWEGELGPLCESELGLSGERPFGVGRELGLRGERPSGFVVDDRWLGLGVGYEDKSAFGGKTLSMRAQYLVNTSN